MRMRVIQLLGWGLLMVGGAFFILQFVFAFRFEHPIVAPNLVLHLLPYAVMIAGIAVLWRNSYIRSSVGRVTWLGILVFGGIAAAGATFLVIYLTAMLIGGPRASLLVVDSLLVIIGIGALLYIPMLARSMR